ncbi:MAG: hypothetical protein ABGY96_12335 [bacterium]|nr:hypothetical protein [Gammaproteobacteria bacterium]HIL96890.1 hypothetical protein [Pseudomonadales bacterium]
MVIEYLQCQMTIKAIDYDDDEIDLETALAVFLKEKNPPRGGFESSKELDSPQVNSPLEDRFRR